MDMHRRVEIEELLSSSYSPTPPDAPRLNLGLIIMSQIWSYLYFWFRPLLRFSVFPLISSWVFFQFWVSVELKRWFSIFVTRFGFQFFECTLIIGSWPRWLASALVPLSFRMRAAIKKPLIFSSALYFRLIIHQIFSLVGDWLTRHVTDYPVILVRFHTIPCVAKDLWRV